MNVSDVIYCWLARLTAVASCRWHM